MAAPYVTGSAALVMQSHPTYTPRTGQVGPS